MNIYIAYALDDSDDVGQLAAMLRAAGWGVRFGPLVEPGPNHAARINREIESARALVAIWSSNSVTSSRVKTDAEYARKIGNLISVRIDAAAVPVESVHIVDLSDQQIFGGESTARAILAAISGMPTLPEHRPEVTGTEATEQTSRKPRKAPVLVTVSAAAIVALLSATAALLIGRGQSVNQPAAQSAVASAPANIDAASHPVTASLDALSVWATVPNNDPVALRAFLNRFSEGGPADQARSALVALELTAWARLNDITDVVGTLTALETFRVEYPDGAFKEDSIRLDMQTRARLAEAQELLGALGLYSGPSNGTVGHSIDDAVRKYQTSINVPPNGLIDVPLLSALRATTTTGSLTEKPASDVRAAPRREEAIGLPFRDCYVCPEMVPIPPGQFTMGDVTGVGGQDERPAHDVTIRYRLAVGRYEVTFEEWDACVEGGVCRHRPSDGGMGRGQRPVSDVSPIDIQEFIEWLGQKTGKRYRLLSEAEWEYSARAGTRSAWFSGNDPSRLCAFANGADASSEYGWRNINCSDGYPRGAAPVGSYKPNMFGLFDMLGNVWEWTADCWHSSYDSAPGSGAAWTTQCEDDDLVLRGGAYSVDLDKMRSSYRYRFASRRMPFFGFRVARVLE